MLQSSLRSDYNSVIFIFKTGIIMWLKLAKSRSTLKKKKKNRLPLIAESQVLSSIYNTYAATVWVFRAELML